MNWEILGLFCPLALPRRHCNFRSRKDAPHRKEVSLLLQNKYMNYGLEVMFFIYSWTDQKLVQNSNLVQYTNIKLDYSVILNPLIEV